jgi:hypothetical protein
VGQISLKRQEMVALMVLLVSLAAATSYAEKNKGETTRLLTGKVVDKAEAPLPDSVVYLTNTRTRAVKTFIVGPDGMYHFSALSPNIDYEVYAQFNGHKSDTKTLSQFDNRLQVNLNLKIDTK